MTGGEGLRLDSGKVLSSQPSRLVRRLLWALTISLLGLLEIGLLSWWIHSGSLGSTGNATPAYVVRGPDPTPELICIVVSLGLSAPTADTDELDWEWASRRFNPIFACFGTLLLVAIPAVTDVQPPLGARIFAVSLALVVSLILALAVKNDAVNVP